ncbi:hypothetical protein GLOIN_2v1731410 [Rhizophagus clarus]|uniref:Uncharacterized protein n=1 Tax=Rhizophagus clarus TaxID=94130 RepID=A0A8H3QQV1_9GLOM|nr:hypothetical protein GLOIN_2v1731410 [Rhizophagus clarus]
MTPGIVEYRNEISENFLLSYDCDKKIVSVELYSASRLLHVFDSDILKISFVNYTPIAIELEKTKAEDIKVGVDNGGKVVSLLFYNSSNRVLKTLSKEERINRKKNAKNNIRENGKEDSSGGKL